MRRTQWPEQAARDRAHPSGIEPPRRATPVELAQALHEISRVERALAEAGDERALGRFADPVEGAKVATKLGYGPVASDEACVVSQLTFLPGARELIRAYLADRGRGPHA